MFEQNALHNDQITILRRANWWIWKTHFMRSHCDTTKWIWNHCVMIVGKIKREEKKLRVFCFTFGACCWFFAGKIEVGESYPIKREHVTSLRLNSSQQQFPISFFHNLLILYFQASPSLLLPHLIFFICHLKKVKKNYSAATYWQKEAIF